MSRLRPICSGIAVWVLCAGAGPAAAVEPAPVAGEAPQRLLVRLRSEAARVAPRALREGFVAELGQAAGADLDARMRRAGVRRGRRAFRGFESAGAGSQPTARSRARAVARRHALRGRRAPPGARIPALENVFVLDLDGSESAVRAAAELARSAAVEWAEPDRMLRADALELPLDAVVPDDRYVSTDGISWSEGAFGQDFPDLYGLRNTRAFEAWADFDSDGDGSIGGGEAAPGEGVVVAVVDSGLDVAHPDAPTTLWTNFGEIPDNELDDDANGYVDDIHGWDFVEDDGSPTDGLGHGTHVAGTVAAAADNLAGIAGIAPGVAIMPLKGLSDTGSGSALDLANAVIYAADNGADVISNSWGGLPSQIVADAFAYAHALGALSVASAGNSNVDAASHSPGNLESVLGVAAVDHTDQRASFSNFGRSVDLAAPGVGVLSLSALDNRIAFFNPQLVVDVDYLRLSGTSMACPHVSGAAAVLLSWFPGESAEELRGRLRAGATPIDAQNPGFEGLLGEGRLDLRASLDAQPAPDVELVDVLSDRLEPSATANVVVVLRNFWEGATGLVATLSTAAPDVSIANASVELGELALAQTTDNAANPFELTIGAGVSYGDTIPLDLTLEADGGYAKVEHFTLRLAFFQDLAAQSGLPESEFLPVRISVADYDEDGLPDLHFVGLLEASLYRNLGGMRFTERGGVGSGGLGTLSSLFADVDGDRRRDLFVGRNRHMGSLLYRQNERARFDEVTPGSGLEGSAAFVVSAIDFDLDGHLDLVTADQGVRLYRNRGAGGFDDVTPGSGLPMSGDMLNGDLVPFDYDGDGDQDLLLMSLAVGVRMYRNDRDGTFVDVTAPSGFPPSLERARGGAAGDYDNDGDLDVFLTGLGRRGDPLRHALFRNQGDGSFATVTATSGDLALGGVSGLHEGNAFFDYDNDGDLDLLSTNEGGELLRGHALYRNDGGVFRHVSELAFPTGIAPEAAALGIADFDLDGALDLYAPAGQTAGSGGGLLRNQIGRGNHWLSVGLITSASGRDPYGARVYLTSGGVTRMREVLDGAVQPLPLHFGLAGAETVERIEVHWPSGRVDVLEDVAADRVLQLVELPNSHSLPALGPGGLGLLALVLALAGFGSRFRRG